MVAYAYLRVSCDHQDVDNQRHGILEYANEHALGPLKSALSTRTNELMNQKLKAASSIDYW